MSSPSQRLVVGLPRPVLDNRTKKLLQNLKLGGIVLFDRNGKNPAQLKDMVKEIHSASMHKIFVAIDYEGGRVQRMKELFEPIKAPADYAKGPLKSLRDDCLKVARQFKSVGININFAPVADVEYQPVNPALDGRVYSSRADLVVEYVQAFIETFHSLNIRCCLKHFPGLGSAVNDPHEAVSLTCQPLERLMAHDMIPFRAGIDSGVDFMMTTHMISSAIDNKVATFSENVIQLARKIGFEGVMITDDMSMGAVKSRDLPGQVLETLACGHDMALVCHDREKYDDIIIHLEKNIDVLNKHGHTESLNRINNVKKKLPARYS